MARDEDLASRITQVVSGWPGYAEKRVFGGVCYLLRGNMVCGEHKGSLILRLGPEGAEAASGEPHTRVFDMTGRPMKGWLCVDPGGIAADDDLERWISRAQAFVETLPPK